MSANPVNFDVAGARQAGYSDEEILNHLAQGSKFDVAGALKAGYQPSEIMDHLRGTNSSILPPPDVNAALKSLVPRPEPNMQQVYLMGGEPRQSLEKQVLPQMIKDQAIGAAQMAGAAPTLIHRSLQNAGLMKPGNVVPGEQTAADIQNQTLPNMVATVGSMMPSAEGFNPAVQPRAAVSAPPPPPPEVGLAPEQQAKFSASMDRANAPYVKQLAAEDLAQRQRGIATRLQDNVQQTHEAVRSGLNERWEDLRAKVGDAPVETKPIIDAIDKSRQMLAGTPADLKIFNEIVKNLDQRSAEETVAGAPSDPAQLAEWIASRPATNEAGSIPFGDARTQYSALGEQWSNADGNLRRALRNAYDAYGNQIQATAEAKGVGGEYSDLKRDWGQYMQDWQGSTPLAKVRNAPHPAYVTPVAKGIGSDLLAEQMARYQTAGADPSIVREMQGVTKAAKIPPLTNPPLPPTSPPGQPGFLLRHAATVAGKVGGGMAGGVVGHPFIGMGIGSEIGSEVAKRIASKSELPAIPKTPEEWHRTALAAKYGDITPGEYARRVTRGGGKVSVAPIPRPPE